MHLDEVGNGNLLVFNKGEVNVNILFNIPLGCMHNFWSWVGDYVGQQIFFFFLI